MSEAVTETFEQKLRRAFTAIAGVKIPDMPEEIIELDKEMNARYPNTVKMTQIIGKNTVLAGEVLKIANSPALRQIWGCAKTMREIIEHSADVAYCAAELANLVQGVTPDEAYVCALFHNGGAILLANKAPDAYSDLFFQSHSLPFASIQKEEALLNTNHMVVGLLMAKKWQLSEVMTQAIYYHHIDKCSRIADEKVRLLVGLLKVANGIVAETSLGAYIGTEMTQYYEDGVQTLMLDAGQIKEVRMALQSYAMGMG